jgi:putative component of membrane protein insertase Oxa1/YidC/SpoIIIJ protein YidD
MITFKPLHRLPWASMHQRRQSPTKIMTIKAQNRFLPMCSNFASQAEARSAVRKICVAVLLNSIRFHPFWYSTSGLAILHSKLRRDATPLILRLGPKKYDPFTICFVYYYAFLIHSHSFCIQIWPNLHILDDFMQIRPPLNPQISKVVRDNPLTPYLVVNRKSRRTQR